MTDLATLDTDDLMSHYAEVVASTAAHLDQLDRVAAVLVDRDGLAHLLASMRDIKAQAAEVYATVEKALLAEAGDKTFEVPGLGVVTVRKVTKRSGWVWDRLVPDLVEKARAERRLNMDTGDVEGEGEATARVLRACIGFSYGKVGGLKARDLDPDEYATTEEDGYSVQLPAVTR